MKTTQEIYEAYRIMPSLQLHQLRVAAVAKIVSDSFSEPIDGHVVISACLLHDMGNILKFDLSVFPKFLEPQGLEYWEGVKAEYQKKYGPEQHQATLAIAREIGVSDAVLGCIDAVAFSKAMVTKQKGSWEEKLCEYADARVSPGGILSIQDRLEEGRKRYVGRAVETGLVAPRERFDELVQALHDIEQQLLSRTSLQAEDIHDVATAPLVEELRGYRVA